MIEREMRSFSQSLTRLARGFDDPWQSLANAIICVAADDYRGAVGRKNWTLINELEEFFRSDWCRLLSSVDIELLLEMLRKDCAGLLKVVNIES